MLKEETQGGEEGQGRGPGVFETKLWNFGSMQHKLGQVIEPPDLPFFHL